MGGDARSVPVGKGWMGRFGLRVWVLRLIAEQFPVVTVREGNRLGCLRGAIVWVTVACPPTVDTERENRHPGSTVQPGTTYVVCLVTTDFQVWLDPGA